MSREKQRERCYHRLKRGGREKWDIFWLHLLKGGCSFFPFILPLESLVFPRFFVLAFFFSYVNKLNKSRRAEAQREVRTGGGIKEILKRTKPTVDSAEELRTVVLLLQRAGEKVQRLSPASYFPSASQSFSSLLCHLWLRWETFPWAE